MGIFAGISNLSDFLNTGIWRIRIEELEGPKRVFVRYLRIVLIALKEFDKDRCSYRASALTYYTLLSIVPVLALGFAVAKGFGLQGRMEKLLFEQFSGHEDVIMNVVVFSRNLLERTSGGVIAGVGAIFLMWSVFQILSNTEKAFNDVWEIERSRTIGRKLSDYLSIMLISPILLIISSSAMVLLATQIDRIMGLLGLTAILPLVRFILGIVPYALIWLLLTFLYMFLPNTKVRFSSGLLGGIVAGTTFVIVQWVYIRFQVGVAGYNAIYGSFAALPLFLIWMNISWIIVLFGMEITDAHQNEDAHVSGQYDARISQSFRMLLSLQVAHRLVKNFRDGGSPLSASRISNDLGIPRKIVHEILLALTDAGLLTAIPADETEDAYHPSRDIDAFTISFVIHALEDRGDTIPVARTDSLEHLSKSLKTFRDLIGRSDTDVRLKDISS